MLLCYPKDKILLLFGPVCVLAQGGRSPGSQSSGNLERQLNPVTLGAATAHLLLADPQWYPARQSLRLDPSEYSCPPAFPLGAWGQKTRAAPESD